MKAGLAMINRLLLASAVVGPMAFVGCFLDSEGTCDPEADPLLDSCWRDVRDAPTEGERRSRRMVILTGCGLISGNGTGLLEELRPGDTWIFRGQRLSPEELEEAANASMGYRLTVEADDTAGVPVEIEALFYRDVRENEMDQGVLRTDRSDVPLIQEACVPED
jgi:hypothetical protein